MFQFICTNGLRHDPHARQDAPNLPIFTEGRFLFMRGRRSQYLVQSFRQAWPAAFQNGFGLNNVGAAGPA